MCRPIALRVTALLMLSMVVAGAVNAMSPNGIHWNGRETFSIEAKAEKQGIELVGLARMRQFVQDGSWLIFDARPAAQYRLSHIPGSLSVPRADMETVFVDIQILLSDDQPVVVYCSGQHCDDSIAVANFLKQQGLKHVAVFEGGMTQWSESGFAVEEGM